MSRVNFDPTADFVLIRPIVEGMTAGGLAIPEGASVDQPRGIVVASGPGRTTEYGVNVPNCVEVGDEVYLAFACREAGSVKLGGKDYMIVRQRDIIGKVPKLRSKITNEAPALATY